VDVSDGAHCSAVVSHGLSGSAAVRHGVVVVVAVSGGLALLERAGLWCQVRRGRWAGDPRGAGWGRACCSERQ